MSKYYVWNKKANRPTMEHDSEYSAKEEAKRLAVNNPIATFHVLKEVYATKKKNTFENIKKGERFRYSGRTYMKLARSVTLVTDDVPVVYNVVVLNPPSCRGELGCFQDTTVVIKSSEA